MSQLPRHWPERLGPRPGPSATTTSPSPWDDSVGAAANSRLKIGSVREAYEPDGAGEPKATPATRLQIVAWRRFRC